MTGLAGLGRAVLERGDCTDLTTEKSVDNSNSGVQAETSIKHKCLKKHLHHICKAHLRTNLSHYDFSSGLLQFQLCRVFMKFGPR